ncbi:MAG: glycosyltransferase [Elusimicrobiales bacterium]|nr:glycosyltransferase [Elusimicrobiales bacterium]
MTVSVIIVTYNRPHDLEVCLNSILWQSVLPMEVVIVDNGAEEPARSVLDKVAGKAGESGVGLKYLPNRRENSLAIGRNMGAGASKGDIVLYLDDDVVLAPDYIKEILRVYAGHPEAVGVQGYITNLRTKWSLLTDFFGWFFCLGYLSPDRCSVLPSAGTVYPRPLTGVVNCEWLSGANQSYRRELLEASRYDENLKKWSQCEDIDFSYRAYKRYPKGLYITPAAALKHNISTAGRMVKKELVHMCEVYEFYFYYRNMPTTMLNSLIYGWSRLGKFFYGVFRAVRTGDISEIVYLCGALAECLRHRAEIKRGDLSFFNDTLK